jgi:hypothetical protein
METDFDMAMVVDTAMDMNRDIDMAWTVDIDIPVLKRETD